MNLGAGKRGELVGIQSSAPFLALAICYANFGTATLLRSRQQCENRVGGTVVTRAAVTQRSPSRASSRSERVELGVGIADTYVDIIQIC